MHTSLDGFAAGPQGEMDWIHVDEEIFDYVEQRISQSDTALYGRVTYQMMENYWPTAADTPAATKHDKVHSAWYKKITKVVLSRSMQGQNLKNTIIISENLNGHINELKQKEGKDILIFGSPSAAHALMQLDLIDGYWLFINPVVIGQGISVFDNAERKELKLINSHTFSSGVVCVNYESKRD